MAVLPIGLIASFACSFFLSNVEAAVLSFPPQNVSDNDIRGTPLNQDTRYDKWLDPSKVLYRFDENAYSQEEKSLIMKAMARISEDMHECINFKEYNPDSDAGWDNIYISKTLNDGSVPPTCFTFYGRLLRAAGQGQKMAIHGGPNGFMDSQREVMKILVNALGLRNEYNRPDRDLFLNVFPDNLQSDLRNSNLLTAYNASQVDVAGRPFDYNSVTIPKVSKYAVENSSIFELINHTVPLLDRLSQDDCLGLSWMYGCDASKCVDPYKLPEAPVKVEEIKQEALPTTPKILIESTSAASTIEASTSTASSAMSTTIQSNESSSTVLPPSSSAPLILSSTAPLILSSTALSEVSTVANISHEVQAENSTLAPILNVTLSDVIFGRKGSADFNQTSATEIPMVINTEISVSSTAGSSESSSTASTQAETTTQSAQLKLVFVANQSEVASNASVEAAAANHTVVNATVAPLAENQTAALSVTESTMAARLDLVSLPSSSQAPILSSSVAPIVENVTTAFAVENSTLAVLHVENSTLAVLHVENSTLAVLIEEHNITATASQPMVNVSIVVGSPIVPLPELAPKDNLNVTIIALPVDHNSTSLPVSHAL
jgi:hypothetical protein